MVAANWLYNIAKRDGLTLGAIHRTLPLTQALGVPQARFDPAKFNWVGTPVQETASCFVRADSAYKTVEDLMNAAKPVKMSATQPRSDIFIVPLMLNNVVGTKLEVTSGYRSLGAAALAVEKGEVSGMCGWGYASLRALRANWFAKNFIRILLQVGREKHPTSRTCPWPPTSPRRTKRPCSKSTTSSYPSDGPGPCLPEWLRNGWRPCVRRSSR